MQMRREEDLLGGLDIPVDVYYGIHTQRAIDNFVISGSKIGDWPLLIKGMVLTKKACASANMDMGTIAKDKCQMILLACDHILQNLDQFRKDFPSDVFQGGAGTSVNMNTNEVIANVALEMHGHAKGSYTVLHPNDHVNKCQSTNDVYPTGFRVAIYYYLQKLLKQVTQLTLALDHKATQFQSVLKMGRTQLQDAVPMSLGDEFSAWSANLKEELKTIKRARKMIQEVNLGATAIGTGVNAPAGYSKVAINHLSKLTNVRFVQSENLVEATSDCGDYVMVAGVLKTMAVKLSKICNDLRLLSSGPRCGLNEINLPQMQAGSSIMPAKVNPVIPEVVNQICFKVIGNDLTVTLASEAGQLQLNVMEPVIAQALFESIDLLCSGCQTLTQKCISGITANAEHSKNMVLQSIGIITYLDPYIGHAMGDMLGKEAAKTGKSIRELVLEKKLLSEKKLNKILSPENLMRPIYTAKLYK
ncbi:MAG: aspartate ammonia-lyase [Deltaproteobacteria bacterium]|nr:aspartate ammonia-lyase [Deltaproteobacteria bacterium]